MWKKLENLPRHENAHAFLKQHFDDNTSFITDCFDRTTEFSSAYPCTSPGGDGCPRRACKLPDGKWVAVCGDSPERCDEVNIEREDTRVYQLNLKRLGSLLAERLQSFGVNVDVQVIDPLIQLVRVGYYVPRGTVRFPVFFHLPLNDGDLPKTLNALSQTADAFILMLPTLELLRSEQATGLRSQKSLAVGVDGLDGTNGFDATKTAAALSDFISLQPDFQTAGSVNGDYVYPTPPNATWEKFIFEWQEEQLLNDARTKKAHRREVFSVSCGSITARLEPKDLNMLDMKTKEPNFQWILLRSFAESGGGIGWQDHGAADNVKTQKKELIKKLKAVFQIDSDPIPWDRRNKCYQCRFVIRKERKNDNA